jgi:membrane-anchored protein YejM (alkaline phosphatase superfamily)
MFGSLLLIACSSPPEPAQTTEGAVSPDIVLVMIDTLRIDALGVGGNSRDASPNIDAFARTGANFIRAYSSGTWTLPASASILTGLQAWEHRAIRDYSEPYKFGRLEERHETIAEALQSAGYNTGAFINNSYLAPEFGLNQGYETYSFEGPGLIDHRTASQTVALAMEWMNSQVGPSFLTIHAMEPHADYQPPPEFAGRFSSDMPHSLTAPLGAEMVEGMIAGREVPSVEDQAYIRALYDEEVLTADKAFGELIEALDARDSDRGTLIVLVSDHGEEFWEYGAYEHGHTTRSVVTQVPLIVRGDGIEPHVNNTVVSTIGVKDLLMGRGQLWELARSGESLTGGIAISEDILYGPQEISVVSDNIRFTFNQPDQVSSMFALNEKGFEIEDISMNTERRGEAEPLFNELLRRRGDLAPLVAADPVEVRDSSVFDQLRALGYVQ